MAGEKPEPVEDMQASEPAAKLNLGPSFMDQLLAQAEPFDPRAGYKNRTPSHQFTDDGYLI